jgi:hypothetical protein
LVAWRSVAGEPFEVDDGGEVGAALRVDDVVEESGAVGGSKRWPREILEDVVGTWELSKAQGAETREAAENDPGGPPVGPSARRRCKPTTPGGR